MTLQETNNILNKNNKRLSVQVSLTGLSFLITTIDTKDIVYFSENKYDNTLTPEELLIEIKALFDNTNKLNNPFDEITVIYATPLYTIVPTSLYDDTKASDYLKFNSKILANDFISSDTIESKDITSVYVPFANINNFFFDRFGSFEYYHASTLLITSILNSEKYTIEPKVYLHINENMFDLVVVKNGSLILCNSYEYKTPEDFMYYVLFCFEQLKLNPNIVITTLLGVINKEDNLYKLIYKYIRNIQFYKSILSQIKLTVTDSSHQYFLLKSTI